jgi:hypothetical protein
MHKLRSNDQRGFSPIILIVVVLVLVGAVGYLGFKALSKNGSLGDAVANKAASIAASQECMKEYNDNDLCKFLSSWSANQKFKVESSTTSEGQTSKSTMTIDGDKTYMKMDGEYAMEVITIGDTTYTKAGDTWWKQTAKKAEDTDATVDKDDFKFEDPKDDTEEKDLTTYVKEGKEACGKFNCFKYKVVDPEDTESTEYIWFDDKDYLIRRTLSEDKDGMKNESVFSYDNISVKVPSPVKELGENQYIMPGQSEPQTMPDQPTEAEMQAMMQQFGQ